MLQLPEQGKKKFFFTANRQTCISASDASLILNFATVSAHLKKRTEYLLSGRVSFYQMIYDLCHKYKLKIRGKKFRLKNRDTNRLNNISLNVELVKGDSIANK